MTDVPVAEDEARQATQRKAVKANVQGHVNAEIADQATDASPGEGRRGRHQAS